MNLTTLSDNLNRIIKQRNMLLMVVILMIVSNLILSLKVVSGNKTVVLVPSILTNEVEISEGLLNDNYISAIARDIILSYLNITPQNIDILDNIVLGYVPSDVYADFKKELDERKISVKQKGISQNFQIKDVVIMEDGSVLIKGDLMIFVGGKMIEQKKKSYKLSFALKNTLIRLNNFEEINSNNL